WALNMGSTASSKKEVYFAVIKTIMKQRPIKKAQLIQFLELVCEICPWFSEDQSTDLYVWENAWGRASKRVHIR
ncbi:endogenous retrovirus group K member 24 Gag polyprotein-like protein, partial [Leptotrombidium deliense]